MKITPLITTTHNGHASETLMISELRTIRTIKNKRKTANGNKNYYSYQLNLPLDLMNLVINDGKQNKNRNFYLVEQNKQNYNFVLSDEKIDAINVALSLDYKKRNVTLTLPKKHMQYLQAYDKYQDVIEILNNEQNNEKFKVQPLIAEINIATRIKEMEIFNPETKKYEPYSKLIYTLSIHIATHLDDDFIEFAKKDTADMDGLPSWLETLKIDWNLEQINETFNIDSNVNKWKY